MICQPISDEIDVCVTIEAKVVFKKTSSGDLGEAVFRKDARLRAEYMARQFEAEIVEKVRSRLAEELRPSSSS